MSIEGDRRLIAVVEPRSSDRELPLAVAEAVRPWSNAIASAILPARVSRVTSRMSIFENALMIVNFLDRRRYSRDACAKWRGRTSSDPVGQRRLYGWASLEAAQNLD